MDTQSLEESSRREAERAFQVSVDSRLLDCFENLWSGTTEILSDMVMLWFEPILDSNGLIEISIGLLLMERVSANIQRYDPKMTMEGTPPGGVSPSSSAGSADGSRTTQHNMDSLFPGGILFGSPFVAVLGGFALALSFIANAPYETRMFAPRWLRALFPRHNLAGGYSSTILMYLLLFLFCLEGMLMMSILMFGCHAITFPEWIEEDVKILTSLMGVWFTSLLTSSFVRYYLYYSFGD